MNRTALLLVLALVATSASVSVADARPKRKPAVLKIKKAPAIPDGLKIAVQEDMSGDMLVDTGQSGMGVMPFKMSARKTYQVDVVDADGDAVRWATVVYAKATKTQEIAGTPNTTDDPRAGQTYHLEAGASGIKITDSAGGDVTATEVLEDLRKDHASMMRGTPIRTFLVGRTFKGGKKVKLGAEEFEAIFPGEATVEVASFVVSLESVKGKVARFSFTASFTDTRDGAPMQIEATGTFDVDTKLVLPIALDFAGTVTATIKQDKTSMSMTGTVRVVSSTTYTIP